MSSHENKESTLWHYVGALIPNIIIASLMANYLPADNRGKKDAVASDADNGNDVAYTVAIPDPIPLSLMTPELPEIVNDSPGRSATTGNAGIATSAEIDRRVSK